MLRASMPNKTLTHDTQHPGNAEEITRQKQGSTDVALSFLPKAQQA